ncbi:MAG: homoaconitate hydratase family protein [Alphaproteobacteria bacterium]|nr:homoaconitate hydratase family protein [Alphaproteobacteria bacterium]
MGMTMTEKILARTSGAKTVSPGEIVVVDVDTCVFIDNSFFPVYWREMLKLANPDKIVVVFDHRVPASDRAAAAAHVVGRAFVKQFGIKRFHDVGRDVGISHVVVSDRAYALPGTVLVCADSHTCSGGAFNCAARGVGAPDMIYTGVTGKTWFRVGETVRYDITGKLNAGVTTKDVFLHIANAFGEHANQNVEFGGPGLQHLSINARRTIATMGAEISADFAIFEADDAVIDYVKSRNPAPFEPANPDADAVYKYRRELALNEMEPLVALPDAVLNNSVPVGKVAGEKIDQAFIGSCANGTLDDFSIAARVLNGRRVAEGVRLLITPGSQEIYREAVRAGYVQILVDAGAIVTNATCGACGGGHLGVLGPGETCITASTRNFKGRMGDPTARIYMGSPATVAASAIAGVITHPGEFTKEALV